MAVTITDVATVAGLSVSTVSRALSQAGEVAPATRDRVQQIADDLGYRPNPAARSLRAGRRGSVALVVPDLANPFFGPVTKAIRSRLQRAGTTLLLGDSDERPAEERAATQALRGQVDALVLWASTLDDAELQKLAGSLPVVLVNREVPGLATVRIDLGPGITQAVEHLVALGHRRCAFVNCSQRPSHRDETIRAAAASGGLELVELGPYHPDVDAGRHAAALIHARGEVTAVLGHNDLVALGMLQHLQEKGSRVPADLSVISIDDTILAASASPSLSTVRIDPVVVADAVADLLTALTDPNRSSDTRPAGIGVTTRFVPRQSSGPAPQDR